MRAKATLFLLNILIILCSVKSILGDCMINLPADPKLTPSYYKYVGSNKLKINAFSAPMFVLHEMQEMEAHCDITFEQPEEFRDANILYVVCRGNLLFFARDSRERDYDNGYPINSITLECSVIKWNLYESSNNFEWCPSNVTSYFLAKPELKHATKSGYKYLAGICYDFYNLSFQSVYYKLTHKGPAYEQLFGYGFSYRPGLEIKYIKESFGSKSISENVFDDDQFKNWIADLNYDFQSIVQHEKLYSTFNDRFAPLLKFVWWRNLRLYNWQRYINALEKHVEDDNKAYNILAGVSGILKAPIMQSCQKIYTMKEVVLNTNQQIPLYVWNYLQDSANATNEVVIIGLNSPFHEFYSHEDIIFCPSKCHEISWLKELSSSFHYNILGAVFCCSVEDVRSSQRLHGFPENAVKPKSLEYVTSRLIFDAKQMELDESEYV